MINEKETTLSQDLSIPGKIFFAALAAYVTGKNPNNNYIKIQGSQEQMKALADAMAATKNLLDAINNPGATIEDIIQKMSDKKIANEEFKAKTGRDFPL